MERLFSSILQAIKQDLLYSHEKRESVARYLYRYAPLDYSTNFQTMSDKTPKTLVSSIHEIAKGKTVADLADVTLQLGAHYWRFDNSSTFRDMWDSFEHGPIGASYGVNLPKIKDMLQDSLQSDLKRWMLLSLFYSSSYQSSEELQIPTLSRILYPNNSERLFGQRLKKFYEKSPLFLKAFFQPPKKSVSNEKRYIDIDNFLDLEIISKIISTKLASANSFILSNQRPKVMPDNPLELFDDLTLVPEKVSDVLQKLLEDNENRFSRILNPEICTVYNHYLLERISCMNYMACFSNLLSNSIHNEYSFGTFNLLNAKGLLDMAASPLLNFRLAFLKTFFSVFHWKSDGPSSLFPLYAERFIAYHFRCTIPIMDVLFHFIIGIRMYHKDCSKSEISNRLSKERKAYFHELIKNRNNLMYHFFYESEKQAKKKIPKTTENAENFLAIDNDHILQYYTYRTVFDKIINYSNHNFLNAAVEKELKGKQAELLQEVLIDSKWKEIDTKILTQKLLDKCSKT